jgi:SAM-dependent methyltransferase
LGEDGAADKRDEATDGFYDEIYAEQADRKDDLYVETARRASEVVGIEDAIRGFIAKYELEDSRVLDIGAGSGALQDVVEAYTGLDIAASARRYFHKPFVHASATALPFPDDTFDVCWTIWTLEHVPDPEMALAEMRRVTRNGGYLYVSPAWNCPTWLSEGYAVRSYAELGTFGKAVKLSIPLRETRFFKAAYRVPVRLIRSISAMISPQLPRLRYRILEANYDHYWMPDADALNSLDCHETASWFRSRGDEVIGFEAAISNLLMSCEDAVIVRVQKPAGGTRTVH